MMIRKVIFNTLILFISNSAFAQYDTLFVRNYGGSGDEPPGFGTGYSGAPVIRAVADNFGNIYSLSFTNSSDFDINENAGLEDVLLVKTSPQGQTIWVKTFGGSSYERAYSIRILSDGNLIIAGKTNSNDGDFAGALGSEDAFLLKSDTAGNIIWTRNYGGSLLDSFFDVIELPAGELIACGISGSIDGDINDASFAGSNKAWVIRMNSQGQPAWSRITNGLIVNEDWEESFWHVRTNLQNDSIFLLGASYNFNDINSDDLLLCSYSLDGSSGFKKVFGSVSGDSPAGLEVLSNGSLMILATVRGGENDVSNYLGGNADAWLLKTTSAGDLIWERNYGGSDLDYAYGMNLNADGAITLSLATRSTNETAQLPTFGLLDALLVHINPTSGDTLFTKRWGSTGSDYAHEVVWSDDLSWFVSIGRSSGNDSYINNNNGGTDLILIKFADVNMNTTFIDNISGFSVFPNPTSGIVNLPFPGTLCIYDLTGKLIHSCKTATQSVQLSIPEGTYILSVQSDSTPDKFTSRLIIKQSGAGKGHVILQ